MANQFLANPKNLDIQVLCACVTGKLFDLDYFRDQNRRRAGITIGPGRFVKKNKRRALNKCRA